MSIPLTVKYIRTRLATTYRSWLHGNYNWNGVKESDSKTCNNQKRNPWTAHVEIKTQKAVPPCRSCISKRLTKMSPLNFLALVSIPKARRTWGALRFFKVKASVSSLPPSSLNRQAIKIDVSFSWGHCEYQQRLFWLQQSGPWSLNGCNRFPHKSPASSVYLIIGSTTQTGFTRVFRSFNTDLSRMDNNRP